MQQHPSSRIVSVLERVTRGPSRPVTEPVCLCYNSRVVKTNDNGATSHFFFSVKDSRRVGKLSVSVKVTVTESPLESFPVCCAVSQQIAKLRLQLQRSKQVSRQSKDREQSSLQLSQQAQHGNTCMLQVSLHPTTALVLRHMHAHTPQQMEPWECYPGFKERGRENNN